MDYVTNKMTLLLLVASVASETILLEDPCIKGSCIVLTDCNYAMQLLQRIRTHPDIKKELRDLHCGFTENRYPKVCCSDVNSQIVYTKSEETATNRPKPSTTPVADLVYQTTAAKSVGTTEAIATSEMSVQTEPPSFLSDPFPNRKICGQTNADDRIIGGTITAGDEFPWMAHIKYKDSFGETSFRCSATLITDRHLISAGHCFQNTYMKSISAISVRLGEWKTESSSECYEGQCTDKPVEISIEKVQVHPKFNSTYADIAVVTLKQPVTFTDFIQPICLPTTEYVKMQDNARESVYWTAGWGITEFGQPSEVKRKVDLDAVPLDICQAALPDVPISQVLICAGGRAGKDSCQGDSGGPLMREVSENYETNWFLYGVTSFGAKLCGKAGIPGAYTRVTAFMDWIREAVQT